MANPFGAYVNTFNAGAIISASGYATFSFVVSQFEAYIPIVEYYSGQVSVGGTVNVFRSTDGGANYANIGVLAGVFPGAGASAVNHTDRQHIYLSPGQYLIGVQSSTHSGHSSASIGFETAWVISAYA